MVTDKTNPATTVHLPPILPATARLPINRCNLPAIIHGSLTYQRHPVALHIDGVSELHRDLFTRLDGLNEPPDRAHVFQDYMTVHFRLATLEDAGMDPEQGHPRARANYLRLLHGWLFDPDSREGAVLKGWVESRFGLLPRWHKGPVRHGDDAAYQAFLAERVMGLYNTNALEAQFDLLYAYCQYELARQYPQQSHLTLYRGINNVDEYEVLEGDLRKRAIVVMNNLNSFTGSRERAGEFGDYVLEIEVPLCKIVFYQGLLPGELEGEEEYMVIGGVYEVESSYL
jgi:NAD+--dinitrogen-reductase ADP-D-ribosyltransferase